MKYDFKRPEQKIQNLAFPLSEQIPSWGFEYMRFRDLHKYTKGESAVCFVIDDAAQFSHSDLLLNFVGGKSFVEEVFDPFGKGHGHHVAGIIAARDNHKGVIGGAPRANLYASQVLGRDGGFWSWIANGIIDAVESKVESVNGENRKVLNLSIGGMGYDSGVAAAIDYAIEEGCIVIVAGGNEGTKINLSTVTFPGKIEDVITISSIDQIGEASFFTSGGPEIDFCAPGDFVNSTHLNGSYVRLSGSSMATPHVSALACLLVGIYKGITHDEVFDFLKEKVGDKKTWSLGYGVPLSYYYIPSKHDVEDIIAPSDPNPIEAPIEAPTKNPIDLKEWANAIIEFIIKLWRRFL